MNLVNDEAVVGIDHGTTNKTRKNFRRLHSVFQLGALRNLVQVDSANRIVPTIVGILDIIKEPIVWVVPIVISAPKLPTVRTVT